ncbi:DUF3380 domain-containing protein [Paenimyroides tangerinum]|uniref:DUF3380 domain-containing protein n=1 Tax=Paenimyroides tangerinum TaxID=2488728 RepID=A0A3P3W3G8_9FLAO|nr:N-acetylmuramidase domain-containing protein [Paenimyroides tangerinum]RRJ87373.1 DUF3380 domain-containing protein [Paenimyroides tangerinum]
MTWELFRQRKDGSFTSTNIKKKGTGIFTFTNNAYENVYKIEGYLFSSEGKEPMSIIVKPQKAEVSKQEVPKTKEVLGVTLSHQDGSKITKALSYMDQLRAVAKFKNMAGEKVTFSLWEDDTKGSGHNKENILIALSGPVQIDSKGNARWDFTLLSTYALFAMAREDDNKQHEYYVLVEYNGNSKASGNVNVNVDENSFIPKIVINKQKVATKTEAQPKPDTAKTSTNKNSKNNKTDTKGLIHSIRFGNKDGIEINGSPKFGDTIYLIIKGENLLSKFYTLKLWEHDYVGKNDLLFTIPLIFYDNNEIKIPITLNQTFQQIGEYGNNMNNKDSGEYSWRDKHQELFAEIIFDSLSVKSSVINVNIYEEYKKNYDQSPALVDAVEKIERKKPVANNSKEKCYCYLQGITTTACEGKGNLVSDQHFESLSKDIGVEAKVFKAVAIVESGGRKSFLDFNGEQKAKILYERHYMYRFLKAFKTKEELENLKNSSPDLVHNVGTYKDPNAIYGTEKEQFKKIYEAKKIDNDSAIKSCSWGKFQVMGKYYNYLYESPAEMEEAMNMCEVQHFAYFKVYLKDVVGSAIITAMKNKNWAKIAELYNGPDYAVKKYHINMDKEYNKL